MTFAMAADDFAVAVLRALARLFLPRSDGRGRLGDTPVVFAPRILR